MRVNQWFAPADRDHRRVALFRRSKAVLEAHHVLERRGVFSNSAAASAGEVAGVQRLKLKHSGKLLRATKLLGDHVARDLGR